MEGVSSDQRSLRASHSACCFCANSLLHPGVSCGVTLHGVDALVVSVGIADETSKVFLFTCFAVAQKSCPPIQQAPHLLQVFVSIVVVVGGSQTHFTTKRCLAFEFLSVSE